MESKYEIEKVTFGDGTVRYYVLKNGEKTKSIIGTPVMHDALEEARKHVEWLREKEARGTVVMREIVE